MEGGVKVERNAENPVLVPELGILLEPGKRVLTVSEDAALE